MKQIEVVSLIKREMKNRRIRLTEMAKGLQMNPSSVSGILERSTLRVQKLADISEFFKYNFFREISWNFPYDEPLTPVEKSELLSLQTRVKELELEVNILRQTIRDMAGR